MCTAVHFVTADVCTRPPDRLLVALRSSTSNGALQFQGCGAHICGQLLPSAGGLTLYSSWRSADVGEYGIETLLGQQSLVDFALPFLSLCIAPCRSETLGPRGRIRRCIPFNAARDHSRSRLSLLVWQTRLSACCLMARKEARSLNSHRSGEGPSVIWHHEQSRSQAWRETITVCH